MAIFHARQVTAQKPGALLNVTLRHALLQPIRPDCFADIHAGASFEIVSRGCLDGNQRSNFLQAHFLSAVPCQPRSAANSLVHPPSQGPVYQKLHIYHLDMKLGLSGALFCLWFLFMISTTQEAACSPEEESSANSINRVWPTGVL